MRTVWEPVTCMTSCCVIALRHCSADEFDRGLCRRRSAVLCYITGSWCRLQTACSPAGVTEFRSGAIVCRCIPIVFYSAVCTRLDALYIYNRGAPFKTAVLCLGAFRAPASLGTWIYLYLLL